MVDVRVTLSGLWIAVVLTFLLGDVLRILAGDITPGEIAGKPATPDHRESRLLRADRMARVELADSRVVPGGLLARGGCSVVAYAVDRPELLAMPEVAAHFSPSDQRGFRFLRIDGCLRVRIGGEQPANA